MMTYTKKYLYNNYFNPKFKNDKLVCFTSENKISYLISTDFNQLSKIENAENNNYGFWIDTFFCTQNPLRSITLIDFDNNDKTTIEGKYYLFAQDENVFYFQDEDKKYCNYLVPKTKEVIKLFTIKESDFLDYPKFVVSNLGIGYSKLNEVIFLDIKTGDILWQLDLSSYFDKPSKIYEGRVLVVGERLVFFAYTEDWEQYATFVLDAKTGEIINDPKETIFGGKLYLFDNYIWQKKDKGFAKMNPLTLEITHYDLSHELSTEIIDNHTMAYHNGIIAVSAKPEKGSIRSLVLLFDTTQEKIIWKQEILHNENKPATNENRRQIEAIQINEKYLAVSTTGYSLYIFEREE